MKFSKEDILARLRNGDSVDQIAEEITKNLNDAKVEYEEEAKRIEEEKAKEEATAETKVAAAEKIKEGVMDYLQATPDTWDMVKDIEKTSVDELVKSIDDIINMVKQLEKIKQLEFKFPEDHDQNLPKASCKTKRVGSFEDLLNTLFG